MAGQTRGRSSYSSGIAIDAAGRAARAASEGEGGNDRRSTPAAGLEGAALDSLSRARSRSAVPGDRPDAVPLPDETESVAVRRAGGDQAVERQSGVQKRQAAAKQEGADDTGPEPESQPAAQGGTQGSGQCSGVNTGPAVRLLRGLGRPRR